MLVDTYRLGKGTFGENVDLKKNAVLLTYWHHLGRGSILSSFFQRAGLGSSEGEVLLMNMLNFYKVSEVGIFPRGAACFPASPNKAKHDLSFLNDSGPSIQKHE